MLSLKFIIIIIIIALKITLKSIYNQGIKIVHGR